MDGMWLAIFGGWNDSNGQESRECSLSTNNITEENYQYFSLHKIETKQQLVNIFSWYGKFPKIGVPPNHPFQEDFPLNKPSSDKGGTFIYGTPHIVMGS